MALPTLAVSISYKMIDKQELGENPAVTMASSWHPNANNLMIGEEGCNFLCVEMS